MCPVQIWPNCPYLGPGTTKNDAGLLVAQMLFTRVGPYAGQHPHVQNHNWLGCGLVYAVLAHVWTTSGPPKGYHSLWYLYQMLEISALRGPDIFCYVGSLVFYLLTWLMFGYLHSFNFFTIKHFMVDFLPEKTNPNPPFHLSTKMTKTTFLSRLKTIQGTSKLKIITLIGIEIWLMLLPSWKKAAEFKCSRSRGQQSHSRTAGPVIFTWSLPQDWENMKEAADYLEKPAVE